MSEGAGWALAVKVHDLVAGLGLTQEEIGEIVDASARSVGRWSAGDVVPQRLNKERLVELAYVADMVTKVLPREHANLWMFSPNQLLGHDKPADRIRTGRYKDVLDLIEAMADGVVV